VKNEQPTEKRIVNKSVNILREKDCLVLRRLKEIFLKDKEFGNCIVPLEFFKPLRRFTSIENLEGFLNSILDPV